MRIESRYSTARHAAVARSDGTSETLAVLVSVRQTKDIDSLFHPVRR